MFLLRRKIEPSIFDMVRGAFPLLLLLCGNPFCLIVSRHPIAAWMRLSHWLRRTVVFYVRACNFRARLHFCACLRILLRFYCVCSCLACLTALYCASWSFFVFDYILLHMLEFFVFDCFLWLLLVFFMRAVFCCGGLLLCVRRFAASYWPGGLCCILLLWYSVAFLFDKFCMLLYRATHSFLCRVLREVFIERGSFCFTCHCACARLGARRSIEVGCGAGVAFLFTIKQ